MFDNDMHWNNILSDLIWSQISEKQVMLQNIEKDNMTFKQRMRQRKYKSK